MHPPERESVPATAVVTPDLSVVVMTYNEAESLADVVGEICAELTGLDAGHEVVLVNDGSDAAARAAAGVAPRVPWQRLGHCDGVHPAGKPGRVSHRE